MVKKSSGILYRLFALILMAVITIGVVMTVAPIANAAEITKAEKSYDIAVVFDNSGSMYDNKGWCRAKYAMEIFAAMLNYDRDKLHIFPMWEVTTDGSKPASGGSYGAIEIRNENDIDKISNMYTPSPKNTPFAPITEAYNYLNASNAEEKWLIVLTDGEFNQEIRNGAAKKYDLQNAISSLASSKINVQYLGFGEATQLKSDEGKHFYAKTSSDTSLKDDLIEICNKIFQRSVLPKNRLNGKKLKLDLSMKNLIVFVQGSKATVSSLKNSKGKNIDITLDSGKRKYSEIAAGGAEYKNAPVDKTLAGQVVTFGACKSGDYTLTYSGADSIQIFYEPDVDIEVSIINNDGQKITKKEDFIAGEYRINSKIIDRATGKDVTNHELMGNEVKIKTRVKTSKDDKFKDYENGAKINFDQDEKTDIVVEGQYLGKYKITSEENPELSWLTDMNVEPQIAEIVIDAKMQQKDSWYAKKDRDNWKPIRVNVTIDGAPMTEEQINSTRLNIKTSPELEYRCEPIAGESAYNVYVSENKDGKYVDSGNGKYEMTISAVYTDESNRSAISKSEVVNFEIQKYSKLIQLLIIIGIILLILLILAAITIFLHKIKVLPKGMNTENSDYKVGGKSAGVASATLVVTNKSLFKKTGIIRVASTKGNMGISLTIESIHPLFKWLYKYQKPTRRRYIVTGLSANNMEYVIIDGEKLTKEDYNDVKDRRIRCGDQASIEFSKMVSGVKHTVKADLMNK